MSLLSSASPWITETTPKKRIPTIRKTVKKQSEDPREPDEYLESLPSDTTSSGYSNYHYDQETTPPWSVDDTRNTRVNHLIEHMASISGENDGKGLADFKPLSHPHVPAKTDSDLLPVPPAFRNSPSSSASASASNATGPVAGDYRQMYEPSTPISYYNPRAVTGSGTGGGGGSDDKILNKINYLIHMMEEQVNEKTNNATEEFIMFTLVGVFIIYVLDSFSRAGKYVR